MDSMKTQGDEDTRIDGTRSRKEGRGKEDRRYATLETKTNSKHTDQIEHRAQLDDSQRNSHVNRTPLSTLTLIERVMLDDFVPCRGRGLR